MTFRSGDLGAGCCQQDMHALRARGLRPYKPRPAPSASQAAKRGGGRLLIGGARCGAFGDLPM